MSDTPRGPVIVEYDAEPQTATPGPQTRENDFSAFDSGGFDPGAFDPGQAPPIVDEPQPEGRTMIAVTALAGRRSGWVTRLVWGATTGLIGLWASVAAWDFVAGMLARNALLGSIALGLLAISAAGLLLFALREIAAFARLARLDETRAAAQAARDTPSAATLKRVTRDLDRLYSGRPDLHQARQELARHEGAVMDPADRLDLVERTLMSPLDRAAQAEIEAAARQVAAATALVPMAFADMLVALAANLRMVRRIAEIYGGRAGSFGSWRLLRTVATHLVATGAVGVADDMIGSILGGGAVAKLSRRFGEGIINGALTARVGVAAIEVCRPLPFVTETRPSVTQLMRRATAGLFARG